MLLKDVPAKWVVYLLADADDNPIQLLCVKNLRASLKRRLGGEETVGPSRKINYREVVRRVHWRRVDGAFEADWIYYEAARLLFPQTYRGMVGFRPAWFVHVNPETDFPRYTKTIDLSKRGELLGPVEDKHAAARLIELVEDAFDLCRYYNILVQAPHGRACAYKEMGKCPAPCDGSIGMDQYHRMIAWSVETLVDPREMIADQTNRMNAAAAALRFELAGKIKQFVEQLSDIGKWGSRHLARLGDFRFVTLQPGPWAGTAKVFLVTPGRVEEILGLTDDPSPADVLRVALSRSVELPDADLGGSGAERIGIVAHHLFAPRQTSPQFLRLRDASEKSILKSWKDLRKAPPPEEFDAEGVLKELQAM